MHCPGLLSGGHYNHAFFWKVMTKPSETNGPSADLKSAIDGAFGSLDEMKTKFNAAAATRFGSGWAWLGMKADGSLGITSTPNQASSALCKHTRATQVPRF